LNWPAPVTHSGRQAASHGLLDQGVLRGTGVSRREMEMFKSIPMLVGGAAGVALAMANGAPSPMALLRHLDSQIVSQANVQTASCSLSWGSQSKTSTRSEGPSTARVAGVHAGEHACFDRLVIDLGSGTHPGYHVRYVSSFRAQGSGNPIPLRGGAKLDVTVADNAASGFPASGSDLADVSGFRSLWQVADGGSFEGTTEIGLGVRSRLPFRVMVVHGSGGGSRLVIDVAHNR
jgi:hypothetical protein